MNANRNKPIVTANIRTLIENGMFSNRCNAVIFTATFDRFRIRENNIDNSLYSSYIVEKFALLAFDDITLAKMFTVKINSAIVGVNLTQIGVKNVLAIGHIIKPMHFTDTHYTLQDVDNYYNSLGLNISVNYGDKTEYFIGKKVDDVLRDKRYKQDILYRGIVNGKEIKRLCQCKFFKDLSSTANLPIDFQGVFGMDKKTFLATY